MAKRMAAVGRIINYDGSEPGTIPCREIEYRVPGPGRTIVGNRTMLSKEQNLRYPESTSFQMDRMIESILRAL